MTAPKRDVSGSYLYKSERCCGKVKSHETVMKMERQIEQLIRIVASLNERVISLETERYEERMKREERMMHFTLNR